MDPVLSLWQRGVILLVRAVVEICCQGRTAIFVCFVDRGVAFSISKIAMVNEFISVVLCVLVLDFLTS